MVKSCSAHGCTNEWTPNSNIRYHRFPLKRPDILQKWINAVCKDGFIPNVHTLFCSEHFSTDDYTESSLIKKRLKEDAIPTNFSGLPHYSSRDVSKCRKRERDSDFVDMVNDSGKCDTSVLTTANVSSPEINKYSKLRECGSNFVDKMNNSGKCDTSVLTTTNASTQTSPVKVKFANDIAKIRKIKILQQQLKRRNKKIDNLKCIIRTLKENRKCSSKLERNLNKLDLI